MLNVSERSFSRVLAEQGINTRIKQRYKILNENYFDVIDTEFKAYVLGLICADGYVGLYNDFTLVFSDVYMDGYKMLQCIQKELLSDIPIHHRYGLDGHGHYELKFSNKHIVQQLNNLNITYKKLETRTKIPPMPNDLKRHFVRGLFDGDGSICTYFEKDIKGEYKQRYDLQFLGNPLLLSEVAGLIEKELQQPIFKSRDIRKIPNFGAIISRSKKRIVLIRDYLYNNSQYYFDYKREKFYEI